MKQTAIANGIIPDPRKQLLRKKRAPKVSTVGESPGPGGAGVAGGASEQEGTCNTLQVPGTRPRAGTFGRQLGRISRASVGTGVGGGGTGVGVSQLRASGGSLGGSDRSASEDEPDEETSPQDLVDFSPVYRCLHIHELVVCLYAAFFLFSARFSFLNIAFVVGGGGAMG